jgi:phosphatidate cytidylyltransferase
MNKLVQRLLIFSIGLPLAVSVIVFFPQKSHLAMNIVVIALSSLGAVEMAGLVKKKNASANADTATPASASDGGIPLLEAAILGAVSPAAMTLVASFHVGGQIVSGILILGVSWVMVSRTFSSAANLYKVRDYITAGFAAIFYPGLFMAWIVRMTRWDHATVVILIFILIAIINDSVAWAFGMLFGKNNRGVIPASPNKSIAGFAGGMFASLLIGAVAAAFLPQAFTPTRFPLPPVLAGIILGLVSGIAASLGDLAESALKRSVNTKDSGNLIPGRGGVLDSIDSIALAAPVYYVAYWMMFA